MPLHDFECENCKCEFEELHKADETPTCPLCGSPTHLLISKLADYTGQSSRTVQYVSRNAPKHMQDSHLTKVNTDTTFLRKSIGHQKL